MTAISLRLIPLFRADIYDRGPREYKCCAIPSGLIPSALSRYALGIQYRDRSTADDPGIGRRVKAEVREEPVAGLVGASVTPRIRLRTSLESVSGCCPLSVRPYKPDKDPLQRCVCAPGLMMELIIPVIKEMAKHVRFIGRVHYLIL